MTVSRRILVHTGNGSAGDRFWSIESPVIFPPLTNLPEFDPYYSSARWYRDWVAYGGVADDGKKTYAFVAQLSRRQPGLKKELSNGGVTEEGAPDSACPTPSWQRKFRCESASSPRAARSRHPRFAGMSWTWCMMLRRKKSRNRSGNYRPPLISTALRAASFDSRSIPFDWYASASPEAASEYFGFKRRAC
jgi:hypothetical protein